MPDKYTTRIYKEGGYVINPGSISSGDGLVAVLADSRIRLLPAGAYILVYSSSL